MSAEITTKDNIMIPNYNLLTNRAIIDILIGEHQKEEQKETFLFNNNNVKVQMPYLSGKQLSDISNMFGLPCSYTYGGGSPSRRIYMDNLIKHCIKDNTINKLINYMFEKSRFKEELRDIPDECVEECYKELVDRLLHKINLELRLTDYELKIFHDGIRFIIKDTQIEIQTPQLKTVDREYIKDINKRANTDIENGDFDSALTKARTLLEEVFCFAIEKKGEKPPSNGDISEIYNRVRVLYGMKSNHIDENTPKLSAAKKINNLLSGLHKIVSSVADMRNIGGDAHGLGDARFTIHEHHARLMVNAAAILADFILSVQQRSIDFESKALRSG